MRRAESVGIKRKARRAVARKLLEGGMFIFVGGKRRAGGEL